MASSGAVNVRAALDLSGTPVILGDVAVARIERPEGAGEDAQAFVALRHLQSGARIQLYLPNAIAAALETGVLYQLSLTPQTQGETPDE